MRNFTDRHDAGRQLAEALSEYKDKDVIVYALPRGGVPLGYEVARFLDAPLDVVITRKIGHPSNPEYAICAIAENGEMLCNEEERASVDPDYLKNAKREEIAEIARRRSVYAPGSKRVSAKDKVAIIVDDGIATGLTIRAALQSIRKEHPEELVVAVPTAPRDVVEVLRKEADTVVVLVDEAYYRGAVGAYYDHFPQTSDEEVIELLASR